MMMTAFEHWMTDTSPANDPDATRRINASGLPQQTQLAFFYRVYLNIIIKMSKYTVIFYNGCDIYISFNNNDMSIHVNVQYTSVV